MVQVSPGQPWQAACVARCSPCEHGTGPSTGKGQARHQIRPKLQSSTGDSGSPNTQPSAGESYMGYATLEDSGRMCSHWPAQSDLLTPRPAHGTQPFGMHGSILKACHCIPFLKIFATDTVNHALWRAPCCFSQSDSVQHFAVNSTAL